MSDGVYYVSAMKKNGIDAHGRTVRIPHLFPVDLSGDKLVVRTESDRGEKDGACGA